MTSSTLAAPANGAGGTIAESGYVGIVLDRLVKQTAQILDMDESCIFVRDHDDSGAAIVAAAHGSDELLVGKRVPAELEQARARTGAAAQLFWRGDEQGSLAVSRAADRVEFSPTDAGLLKILAHIAGAAVCHVHTREALHADMRARIGALVTAMDARDGYTARHSQEVVSTARATGTSLGLDRAELAEIEVAALLHDLGKVRVPDTILNKRGPLTPDEQSVMTQHPVWGAEILTRVPGLEVVAAIVRFHHERWDGEGYPNGLSGERIPLASRIIAVCDSHNAMTSDRPYRRALPGADALAELRTAAGWQFDPEVVSHFTALIDRKDAA
jgi:putative nucleotidyltransferase with HDIG domain